jgi:dolichyl-phosphate-mannose-protein mannosyltransferase
MGPIFKKYKVLLLFFILFFLSRVFFINTGGVFFDSQEYIDLFSLHNYLLAIARGHFPPHVGYIIIFWPIFQISNLLKANSVYIVILCQIILSFITLYCFYQFIKYISDKIISLLATIIASVIPLFWIINVTVMMENAYAFFCFFSLYILTLFLEKPKKKYLLHLSLFSFTMGILTQTMTVLWFPLYLYLVFLKQKKIIKEVFLYFIFYVLIFSLLNIFEISYEMHMQPETVFYFLYFSKRVEFAILTPDLHGLYVLLRNFLAPLLQNNSILIVLLAFSSLVFSFRENKRVFIFGLLFILPAIYANQWWDSLLPGRHALLASFGMAFLIAYLLKNNKILFTLLTCYILIVSLPALDLLKKTIPYLEEANYVATLPKKSFLIESHFARPQIQDAYRGTFFSANEPNYFVEQLPSLVNKYLKRHEPVYISSAALSEPYGLYSGPYLHSVSLSYEYPFLLKSYLAHYTIVPYKTVNAQDNLIMYKIISAKSSPYPQIKDLRDSYRRLNYTDPLWQITWWFETTFSHR